MMLTAVAAAAAQNVYTPERGSAERKAILDVLRLPVEKVMKQKIVFVVQTMNVQGNWAFTSGYFQRPDATEPILSGTIFDGDEDIFENNFFGLLRKTGGKWRITTHAVSCTDVCYSDWWSRFKAPKAIFPYTE
jgi:hypothetical protein